jgi:hypothetical protein
LHRAARRLRWALQTELDATADSEPRGLAPDHRSQGALS